MATTKTPETATLTSLGSFIANQREIAKSRALPYGYERNPAGSVLEVEVTDPNTFTAGKIDSFVQYKVTSSAKGGLPGWEDDKPASVHRRYKDFLALRDTLAAKYPGVVLPVLPEKSPVTRFKDEFVEKRRQKLDQFMKGIAAHEILKGDAVVFTFCNRVTDESEKEFFYTLVKEGALAGTEPPPKRGLFGFAKDIKASLTALSSSSTPPPGVDTADPDAEMVARRAYVNGMISELLNMGRAIERMEDQRENFHVALHELAGPIRRLSIVETNRQFSATLKELADALESMRQIQIDTGANDYFVLALPFQDLSKVLSCVADAFSSRNTVLSEYQSALKNLAKVKASYDKEIAKGLKPDKLAKCNLELNEAEGRVTAAAGKLARVTNALRTEIARIDHEKHRQLRQGWLGFVQSQVEFETAVGQLWDNLVPMIEKIDPTQGSIADDTEEEAEGRILAAATDKEKADRKAADRAEKEAKSAEKAAEKALREAEKAAKAVERANELKAKAEAKATALSEKAKAAAEQASVARTSVEPISAMVTRQLEKDAAEKNATEPDGVAE